MNYPDMNFDNEYIFDVSFDNGDNTFETSYSEENMTFPVDYGEITVVRADSHNSLKHRDLDNQHPINAIAGLQEALDNKVETNLIGNANGVAPLDEEIKIPLGYIPLDTEISETSQNPLSNSGVYTALRAVVEELKLEMPKIEFGTQEYWNSQRTLIGVKNTIYVYTNCIQYDNYNLARIKIGDGSAYLIDAPFIDAPYYEHIHNDDIHVTLEEKAFWNDKVTCYLSLTDEETVIFTKD